MYFLVCFFFNLFETAGLRSYILYEKLLLDRFDSSSDFYARDFFVLRELKFSLIH